LFIPCPPTLRRVGFLLVALGGATVVTPIDNNLDLIVGIAVAIMLVVGVVSLFIQSKYEEDQTKGM